MNVASRTTKALHSLVGAVLLPRHLLLHRQRYVVNLSFVSLDPVILLPKQNKVTMEFGCTMSRIDRCFHLIFELDLITNQQTVTRNLKPEQDEICSWPEQNNRRQLDLYGARQAMADASAQKQAIDTVCWWHKLTASNIWLCCYFVDPHRLIIKSVVVDKSSPHFEILKRKVGLPSL